ncbi:MAG: thiamine pyrophosphate-dependent enzyme [Nanoarchaeota archaeon]|nr:thiamine pyrophosphate-dependent enzyme [Nanoarchaeota archaeon]
MQKISKEGLIDFEKKIADLFEKGEIPYLIHLSGGNEEKLIDIFKNINEDDYIFSTHRNHYHYLLKGGSKEKLENFIMNGKSMFVFDKKLKFYSSSIVAATPSIAAGVALALKRKGSKSKVWCFIGDGAEDNGHFYEAVKYVDGWDLPCVFIIEDNDRSVDSPKKERYGNSQFTWPNCVIRYEYIPTYPHSGTGKFVEIKKQPMIPENKYKTNNTDFNKNNKSKMKFKDAVKLAMENLAEDKQVIFVGYNVLHGSAYGTLKDIPNNQRLETPLAENLMAGLAMGLSLESYKPVLFFERHDFILNAIDAIFNQIDKISDISNGEFNFPIIIKAVVGSKKPLFAGITHTQDFSELFKKFLFLDIYEPKSSQEVLDSYKNALLKGNPCMIIEKRELYDQEL